jgi:molybdopterin synthase catalytic subunit
LAVRVQREDFDVGAEVRRLTSGRPDIGAIVTFIGTVRSASDGASIASMTLEHYPGMTEAELARVEAEAARRWPLQVSLIVHRVGMLKPGDNIVLVVTASAHRQAAFSAAEFLMDYLKTSAPFWKKEHASDGTERWVEGDGNGRAESRDSCPRGTLRDQGEGLFPAGVAAGIDLRDSANARLRPRGRENHAGTCARLDCGCGGTRHRGLCRDGTLPAGRHVGPGLPGHTHLQLCSRGNLPRLPVVL